MGAVSTTSTTDNRSQRRRRISRRTWTGYLYVAPLMLWLAFTILYPLISAVFLSVQDIKIIGTPGKFIGLANYTRLLTNDAFWESLLRSGGWVIGNAAVQTFAAFAAALILNQRFRGRGAARIWIILSWIVPAVVVVIIWRWLLSSSGVVNYLLTTLGIVGEPIGFFVTEIGTLNQVVHLWKYDSMADREQRRAKLAGAPNWGDYLDAATPFLLRMENRILVPTAFSPMK